MDEEVVEEGNSQAEHRAGRKDLITGVIRMEDLAGLVARAGLGALDDLDDLGDLGNLDDLGDRMVDKQAASLPE